MFDDELGGQVVALAGRPGRARRGTLADTSSRTCGQPTRRVCALGRHARHVLGRLRLRQGHLPSVLHGRHGAGDRRSGRRGRRALWRLGRQSRRWSWVLPATIVGTVLWADALLARTSGYDSWLGPTVVVTGVISALLLFLSLVRPKGMRWLALPRGHRGRGLGAGRARGLLPDDAQDDDERHRHRRTHLGRWCTRRRRRSRRRRTGWKRTAWSAGDDWHEAKRRRTQQCRDCADGSAPRRNPSAVAVTRRPKSRIDGEYLAGAVPGEAPGLRHVPRRSQWLAVGRPVHPRERQGRDRHGRLRWQRPGADAERVSNTWWPPARCTTCKVSGGSGSTAGAGGAGFGGERVVARSPDHSQHHDRGNGPDAAAQDRRVRGFRRAVPAPSMPGSRSTGPRSPPAPMGAPRRAGPFITSAAPPPPSDVVLSNAAGR